MSSLSRLVDVRKGETSTAWLMFAYAYLAMTAYNIIQPLTRSKLIASLGAVNVPWVIFGSGLFIGVLMLGYTRVVSMLPRRWALPITQAGMAAMMVVFWALFRSAGDWVSVAFYVWGGILGILLISQFWTLANGIYDPRQAKRSFPDWWLSPGRRLRDYRNGSPMPTTLPRARSPRSVFECAPASFRSPTGPTCGICLA
jgi:AAA family ATP:ADP antiporter